MQSSFAIRSGSRFSGAVIIAWLSAWLQPCGQISRLFGNVIERVLTVLLAAYAFAASVFKTSLTSTAEWPLCQQSKSVTIESEA